MHRSTITILTPEEFGQTLRTARRSKGMTQATAAARAGVSERLWNEVETNKRRRVSLERAMRMAQIMGFDLKLAPRADSAGARA